MTIIANSPQILLFLWYLSYNTVLTRWHMATEWDEFWTSSRPLRVTTPNGQQLSTYWLQLPLKYGIPMMVANATIHWSLSNAFYIFVGQGGYYVNDSSEGSYGGSSPRVPDPFLPLGSILGVRCSHGSMIIVVSLCTFMIIVLIGLVCRLFKGRMPLVGSHSAVISAACHVSDLLKVNEKGSGACECDDDNAMEMVGLTSNMPSGRELVAQSSLRWGIVRMPPDWYNMK
ncbi:hypothetical protein SCAR479_02552 [Seiridium cardinale]|uniref:Uncharacterized protein n=1 Tax=Seiridium cardinale TaxID=138064 RepID=A0ABR2Y375_9PEZI